MLEQCRARWCVWNRRLRRGRHLHKLAHDVSTTWRSRSASASSSHTLKRFRGNRPTYNVHPGRDGIVPRLRRFLGRLRDERQAGDHAGPRLLRWRRSNSTSPSGRRSVYLLSNARRKQRSASSGPTRGRSHHLGAVGFSALIAVSSFPRCRPIGWRIAAAGCHCRSYFEHVARLPFSFHNTQASPSLCSSDADASRQLGGEACGVGVGRGGGGRWGGGGGRVCLGVGCFRYTRPTSALFHLLRSPSDDCGGCCPAYPPDHG